MKTPYLRKRTLMTFRGRRAIAGYLFILPFIIGFLAFMLRPLYDSLYMSFCKVTVSNQGFGMEWIGIQNFSYAFAGDPEFVRFLTEEITKTVTNSLATLVLAFVIAVLLNNKFKGRTLVRAIFFLPVILSSGVLVGLESNNSLLSSINDMIRETSPININETFEEVLSLTGIGGGVIEFLFGLMTVLYDIVIAAGIQILVFLSGLQTISPSLYEAADIEGCTRWESFWKITFPMVSPLLLVNCVYTIIDYFTKSDNQVMEKINTVMYLNYNFGFASAMSWIYFVIVIAILGVLTLVISRGVHYYE